MEGDIDRNIVRIEGLSESTALSLLRAVGNFNPIAPTIHNGKLISKP